MSGRFVESEVVIGRAYRDDETGTLWEERVHNSYHGGLTMGPYSFAWIYEIERGGEKDRCKVPAGLAMTWEPII